MNVNKFISTGLISAVLISGLALAHPSVNASRIKPNAPRTHLATVRRPITRHAKVTNNRQQGNRRQRIRRGLQPKRVNRSFPTVNNRDRDYANARWEAVGNGKRETIKSTSGPRVSFKTVRFLPNETNGIHFIQSINVTPNGHYAYMGCDAFPYLSGNTKIIRVNLRRRKSGIKIGPRFYGGHGQALAYNPKARQLWLMVDPTGPMNHGNFDLISTKSLKPTKRVAFNLHGNYLGDTLAFDNKGNAYNENRIWEWDATPKYHQGNVVLYKGRINRHNVKFNRINQGIRYAPGYIIQGIAYNGRTKRFYIETDDAIMSIPVNKLGRLKPRDVKETRLQGHREYEGISFDRKGRAYIVLARPNEILRSTRVF